MIASSMLARPVGAAPAAAALRLCVDLPDRLNTSDAPSGKLHVASKAASRWRVAEALHSKWVRGMSEPPYGRHVGMACFSGGQTCHSTAAIRLTAGFLDDSTSFELPSTGMHVCV